MNKRVTTKAQRLTFFAFLVLSVALVVVLAGVWFFPAINVGHRIEDLIKVTPTIRFPMPSALPPTQPMPSYVVVYPKPEQVIAQSSESRMVIIEPDDPQITTFNISVEWEPGSVCVVFDAAELLQPGDFWESDDIVIRSSLTLNRQQLEMAPMVMDGIVAQEVTLLQVDENGMERVVGEASTGGPYGMCWKGSSEEGLYVAEFSFEEHSYIWWYQIDD